MKNKVFLTVFIGVALIMGISSILVYTQLYTVQSVNLDPLTDSLYREDSKVLNWILSSIPLDKIDTLKLPDSWAEIFVVNNSDLNLVNSSNPAHKGMALHKHPLLLDQVVRPPLNLFFLLRGCRFRDGRGFHVFFRLLLVEID